MKAAVLIDFDNYVKTEHGSSAIAQSNALIAQIVSELLRTSPGIDQVEVRLYGGWLQDGNLTRRASEVLLEIGQCDLFPLLSPQTKQIVRGTVELAYAIRALPHVRWPGTYRTKNGHPPVRLASEPIDTHCQRASADHCPIRIYKRFVKRPRKLCPVDSCTVTNVAAFQVYQQKMVDTMLACDLIAFAMGESTEHLILCSDDVDLLPALLMSSSYANTAQIHLWQNRPSEEFAYSDLLDQSGIRIREVGAAI